MHGLFNHPEVGRYLWDGEPVSRQTTSECLVQSERDLASNGLGLFGVYARESGGLTGFCGFRPSPQSGQPELLYALLPEWRGRGLATEAAQECLRLAFEAARLRCVLAGVDAPNTDSVKLLERLGMSPAESPPDSSGVLYYAITAEEFRAAGTP